MKLNRTIHNREAIFKDTIPGIEVFRNVKFQAPNSSIIQYPQYPMTQTGLSFWILVIVIYLFFVIYDLEFGAWNLIFPNTPMLGLDL